MRKGPPHGEPTRPPLREGEGAQPVLDAFDAGTPAPVRRGFNAQSAGQIEGREGGAVVGAFTSVGGVCRPPAQHFAGPRS